MTLNGKDLKGTYRNFVVDSWLKSYRYSPECKYMLTSVYKELFWSTIQREIDNSLVQIIDDENNKIRGYLLQEPMNLNHESELHSGLKNIIKFLYVTSKYRRQGIATELLKPWLHPSDNKWVYCSFITPHFVGTCNQLGYKHMYLPNLRRVK